MVGEGNADPLSKASVATHKSLNSSIHAPIEISNRFSCLQGPSDSVDAAAIEDPEDQEDQSPPELVDSDSEEDGGSKVDDETQEEGQDAACPALDAHAYTYACWSYGRHLPTLD